MGAEWQHEVKFDGYRIQAHAAGGSVELFSKIGASFALRFPTIAYQLRELPVRWAIIAGELVASDRHGGQEFVKLQTRALLSLKTSICGRSTCWRSTAAVCGKHL